MDCITITSFVKGSVARWQHYFFLTLSTEHILDHTEHFFCNEQANARIYTFYIPSLFPYITKETPS